MWKVTTSTLFRPMDFYIKFDAVKSGWSIIYWGVTWYNFQKLLFFFFWRMIWPSKQYRFWWMPHIAAFHLDLHCLHKYQCRGSISSLQRVNVYAQLLIWARGLSVGLSLHHLPYFAYLTKESLCETVKMFMLTCWAYAAYLYCLSSAKASGAYLITNSCLTKINSFRGLLDFLPSVQINQTKKIQPFWEHCTCFFP